MKGLGSRSRVKERIYTKKKEGLLIVKKGKRGGASICGRLSRTCGAGAE